MQSHLNSRKGFGFCNVHWKLWTEVVDIESRETASIMNPIYFGQDEQDPHSL